MRVLILILGIIISSNAYAQSLSEVSRSARSRAMGGVLVPFVKDADALFVNPAALTESPLLDIKLLHLEAAANKFTIDHYKEFQDIDPNNPTTFNQFYGEKIWAEVTGKTAISVPHFALGYLNNAEVAATLHNPAFPHFETYFRQDEAIYLGAAFSLAPGTSLGFAFKRVQRWGGEVKDISVSDISDSSSIQDIGSHFENKGQGYGADMALMTQLSAPLSPTFALVWEDIGSTQFTKTAGQEAPSRIEQNLTFGAGVSLDLPGIDISAGLEARHLLDYELQAGKKLHWGAEVSLPLFDFRAGFNQGYFTYGAGFNFLIFHVDAVSYTEELGVYPGQTGDARYMVSLNIDLSFDANFNFTDNNGKKRRVKQRR